MYDHFKYNFGSESSMIGVCPSIFIEQIFYKYFYPNIVVYVLRFELFCLYKWYAQCYTSLFS